VIEIIIEQTKSDSVTDIIKPAAVSSKINEHEFELLPYSPILTLGCLAAHTSIRLSGDELRLANAGYSR
jgi:hypothetical protein